MEILNFTESMEWIVNNFFLAEIVLFGFVLFVFILTTAFNAIGLLWKEWM